MYCVLADPNKISQLPQCDTTGNNRVLGYEEVIAIGLDDHQETKTGQVFCVYKQ